MSFTRRMVDDFIIRPPGAPLPTLVATGTRVLLTDPIPGFPFHDTRTISALQQRYISSILATCATRLCRITNFARHRKRHHHLCPLGTCPYPDRATETQFRELSLPLFVRTCEAPIVRLRLRTKRWEAFLVTTTNWFPPVATPLVVLGGAVAT